MSIVYWPNAEYKTTKDVNSAAIVESVQYRNQANDIINILFGDSWDILSVLYPERRILFFAAWHPSGIDAGTRGWVSVPTQNNIVYQGLKNTIVTLQCRLFYGVNSVYPASESLGLSIYGPTWIDQVTGLTFIGYAHGRTVLIAGDSFFGVNYLR